MTKRQGRRFSPLAFYVTRWVPSTWLTYSPEDLEELFLFLPGKHLTSRIGSWRARRQRRKGK
jgi:hypothetical protein